jgi:hypothetical protein
VVEVTILTLKRSIPALALVGALVVPATAAGKTHKLSGPVEGDANATVSMKVVVKKGKPKKVKGFAWQGLDGFCDDTFAGEQTGTTSLKTGPFPSPFRIFGPYDQATSPGDVVDISGTVKQKGKKVIDGLIAVSFNNGFCTAPPLERRSFTATK